MNTKILIPFLCLLALESAAPLTASEPPVLSSPAVSGALNGKAASGAVAKPDFWATAARAPGDFGRFIQRAFSAQSLPWLAAIGGSTALLIEDDDALYAQARRLGRRLGLPSTDNTRTFVRLNGFPLLRGPTDVSSAMYFIGDGWTSAGLIASFGAYGLAGNDRRAARTAFDLTEGMFLTGFVTQALKRATGRETPAVATAERGVWRFFPSFKDFFAHQPRYDAFPSGHVANCLMEITIIADNYPEKKFIRPVGYSLLGLLSFQMVNNGVHWASDYPLGLGIGYLIAKSITANYGGPADTKTSRLTLYPSLAPGQKGLNLAYAF